MAANPWIPNTQISRWTAVIVTILLTVGISWAIGSINSIGESTTKTLEDIKIFETLQEENSKRITKLSGRIDRLYQLSLEHERDKH